MKSTGNFSFKIRKASGELQDFSKLKFINSLKKSGLDQERIDLILKKLGPRLKEGLSTKRLYKLAHTLIKKNSYTAASRYAFPRTLSALGPDGFNFEKFVAGLMQRLGYSVKIGVVLKGRCVSHEVDVIASKQGKTIYMECKFHNSLNFKEDVKTALYVNARKMDLKENTENNFDEYWLVTNSKFTLDALTYSSCSGLKTVSPYDPEGQSLYDLMVKAKAHPIGIINSLRPKDQSYLIGRGIFFVKDLLSAPNAVDALHLSKSKGDEILREARALCSPF
ncbi:MAG: ATPase [Halobacteriovorax sp.]|nr:ATPase [Halobacteriovorax sp.]